MVFPGGLGQFPQEALGQRLATVLLVYRKSDFGHVILLDEQVFSHGNHLIESEFTHHGNEGQILHVVNLGHGFDFGTAEAGLAVEKAQEHIVFVQGVVVLLNTPFIHGLGRSDGDFLAVDGNDFLQFDRINGPYGFAQGPFSADQFHFLGRFEQFVTKLGVGNTDYGQGPFLQAFTRQVDGTVFGHHELDVPPWNDDCHFLAPGNDVAGRFIRCGGRQHED